MNDLLVSAMYHATHFVSTSMCVKNNRRYIDIDRKYDSEQRLKYVKPHLVHKSTQEKLSEQPDCDRFNSFFPVKLGLVFVRKCLENQLQ
ncbi:hypothetical protein M378DRAFT_174518 [Amanita muscaria Koide BX008]|uniref:Uncharacterized protein n=1 Tax=Amanita muscaria (strain Koide BX008) TaxID=946122 RepID=A0A0C2WBH5_AMAMK|nr:hypothetical protein M378DRAFT_174519 [Amanita muscaria Koide BX008]KIL53934.1 hypothetical protein M378DRAFT_174518 [Amanita muscaria Koide BX008]